MSPPDISSSLASLLVEWLYGRLGGAFQEQFLLSVYQLRCKRSLWLGVHGSLSVSLGENEAVPPTRVVGDVRFWVDVGRRS